MSTYSQNLRVELIAAGAQAGSWGTTTNNNFAYVFEEAISGAIAVSVLSQKQALTYTNGPTAVTADNQSIFAVLVLTTTTSAAFEVYAPPTSNKMYVIKNNASYDATIYNSTSLGNTTAAGAGIVIPAGKSMLVWTDGTNFYQQLSYLNSPTLASATLTTPTITTPTVTNGTFTSPTLVTPALGTPTAGVMTNVTGTAAGLTAGLASNVAGGLGGQVLYQSAADTTAKLANGTAGQFLQSNGTTAAPTWVDKPLAGYSRITAITSTSTYTVPSGVTQIKVTVIGGGAGGGANSGACAGRLYGGAGGGAGGTAIKVITGLTPGGTISVTIGAGGTSYANGGTTSFGAYCSATGGSASTGTNYGGAGGVGSGGDINIGGGGGSGGGGLGASGGTAWTGSGAGGSSYMGGGGNAGSGNGGDGQNYGGGGGGALSGSGGTGGNGVVIVEY